MKTISGHFTLNNAQMSFQPYAAQNIMGNCLISVDDVSSGTTKEEVVSYLRSSGELTLRVIEDLNLYSYLTAQEIAAVGLKAKE